MNKYFNVNNEKEELINLLMNFVPSSKKKAVKPLPKVEEIKVEAEKVPNSTKDRHSRDSKSGSKQVENIEIVPERKKNISENYPKKPRDEIKTEFHTIDKSNFTTIQNSNKYEHQYASLDDGQPSNSRNNNAFGSTEKQNYVSVKAQRQEKIDSIKNRRTGSTD